MVCCCDSSPEFILHRCLETFQKHHSCLTLPVRMLLLTSHGEGWSYLRSGYPLCKPQCTQKRCFSASMAAPLSIRDLSPGSLQKGSNVVQEFCGPGHRSCLESQCWFTSKLGGGREPTPSPSSGHSEVLLHDPPRMPTAAPSWSEGKAWAQKLNESQDNAALLVAKMNPSALSGDRLPGASDPILATPSWRQR